MTPGDRDGHHCVPLPLFGGAQHGWSGTSATVPAIPQCYRNSGSSTPPHRHTRTVHALRGPFRHVAPPCGPSERVAPSRLLGMPSTSGVPLVFPLCSGVLAAHADNIGACLSQGDCQAQANTLQAEHGGLSSPVLDLRFRHALLRCQGTREALMLRMVFWIPSSMVCLGL